MQYLSEQGCAKPLSTQIINTQTTSKKGVTDKTTATHAKSILIPRDLEKIIRTARNRQLDASQLKIVR